MSPLYHLNVTLHQLAMLLWLGGMFFLEVVGAPVLRTLESPSLRAQVFRRLGERFRTVGWIANGVLIATGIANRSCGEAAVTISPSGEIVGSLLN